MIDPNYQVIINNTRYFTIKRKRESARSPKLKGKNNQKVPKHPVANRTAGWSAGVYGSSARTEGWFSLELGAVEEEGLQGWGASTRSFV